MSAPAAVYAADDLLETLAQKGVISMEEYEKLKAQRKATPSLTTDDGLKLLSGDGAFSLQVGTLQQIDIAAYQDDRVDNEDGTESRRSRLSLGGTFFKDWQYRAEYEFATGSAALTDAYVAYTARKPVIVTVGQFKPPFSMEALSADKSATFMERALPFYLVSPLCVRAPGVQLGDSGVRWSLNAGVFGEPVGNAQAGDEGYGAAARATFAPLLFGDRVIHLGLSKQWRNPTADNSTNATGPKFETVRFRAKPESNILSRRLVDTGEIANVDAFRFVGAELAGAYGPASLQGEHIMTHVTRKAAKGLDFSSSYVQAAYTLTGESRSYKSDRGVFEGVRPTHNLGAEGWGAFELAARYSRIDLSDADITGGREHDATFGLNWYLNPILRVSANVVRVLSVEGGKLDGEGLTAYQMRFQLAI